MNQWHEVAIALGANLGERESTLKRALDSLALDCLMEMKVSRFYETAPEGILDQPAFLNAVAVGRTEWKPPALLNFLKTLERSLGRIARVRNGPREIDLDLLIFGNEIWNSEGVEVPHPRMWDRAFVLLPLNDVWPEWAHPTLKETVKSRLRDLPKSSLSAAKVFE